MCGPWTEDRERKKERLDPSNERGLIKKRLIFKRKKYIGTEFSQIPCTKCIYISYTHAISAFNNMCIYYIRIYTDKSTLYVHTHKHKHILLVLRAIIYYNNIKIYKYMR